LVLERGVSVARAARYLDRQAAADGRRYPDVAGLPQTGPSGEPGDALHEVYLRIRCLPPADAFHSAVPEDCVEDYRVVIRGCMTAIENDRLQISTPFDVILIVWLMIIFGVFGLIAPRNPVSLIGIASCSVALSLAMFVIFSLSHPCFIAFSSADMRAALAGMTTAAP